MKELLITLFNLIFLFLLFLISGFTINTKTQEDWFKVYVDDVERYEFKNNENNYIDVTNEMLFKITESDSVEAFWDTHKLTAIILKDVE